MLYPQNGDRIVTIDSVTSLHPMYYRSAQCRRLANTTNDLCGSYAITVATFTYILHINTKTAVYP